MADLGSRSRGQLILVAAFALAVTFVALALVVNSAIFTENLASRGETGGSGDALTLRHDVERGVGQSIASANVYNTTDQSTLEQGVDRGIGNVNTAYSRQSAADTAIVNVSRKSGSIEYGSRIAQNTSGGRAFQDRNGNSDWHVVDDVDRSGSEGNATRAFELNVTKSSLEPDESGAFRIVVEEWKGSATWTMTLWRDGPSDDVHVEVEVDSEPEARCMQEVDGAFVHVDVTEGRLAGEPCGALRQGPNTNGDFGNYRFASGVGDRYNVTFEHGDEARGNYSLVTRNQSMASSNTLNASVGSDSPYWDDAIYDVTVRYVYNSPKLEYETDVRVAPGESR
ncbi:hypothetical protein OB920_01295 [Halobacteria archaeon HArc-gm2]|nr:hypothetical protein [Halobacteria archaeon HArc-gm2]